jgi:hypothetical protein
MPKAVYSSPARGTPFKYAGEHGAQKGRVALVKDLVKDIIKVSKKFEKKKKAAKKLNGLRFS